jgi:predicted amidohydrolase
MRLALLQTAGAGAVADTLELLEAKAAEAAAGGARLLIAPEMFLTGYNIGDRAWALAEPADGPSAQRATEIAQRHGLALLYGFPEFHGDSVYNAVLWVDPEGHRQVYRKAHLFGPEERRLFRAGPAHPPLVRLEGLSIGLLICYDVEFPEAVRALAQAGAELIAVPTALMVPYDFVADALVPTRAYENGVYVAYVNRAGAEGELAYVGRSCLVGPDGRDVARAEGAEEALLRGEVDVGQILRLRRINPYFHDLRRDLYD